MLLLKKTLYKIKSIFYTTMLIHYSGFWKIASLTIITSLLFFGYLVDNYNVSILSVLLLLLYNVHYFLGNRKERCLFFLMNFSLFLFLISRPLISLVRGNEWWYFDEISVWKAVSSLFIALFSLNIGFCYGEKIYCFFKSKFYKKLEIVDKVNERKFNYQLIKQICYVLFFIGFVSCLFQEVPKLFFSSGKDYVDLYSEYENTSPFIIRLFATMMPYFLCGYLVCLPNKRKAFVPLGLYVISGVPGFIVGARSAMMVKLMFVAMYYFIRDYINVGKDVWIGKIEKILIIILLPLTIIGLGLYNYVREGSSFKKNDGNVVVNFFYLQGTSFDTLCEGFIYENELRSNENVVSYTFGSFVDYVKYGTASQILFGNEGLEGGNSIDMATKSNSLAHHLSYLVLEQNYLDGHGRGSSYILETYMDFGFLGVFIYTFLLGSLLRITPVLLQKSWLTRIITLISLLNIFMIPRSAAMDMFGFIITLQFWIAVALVLMFYLGFKYICKRYLYEK